MEFQKVTTKGRKETKDKTSRLASPDSVDGALGFWAIATEREVLQDAVRNTIRNIGWLEPLFTGREWDVLNLSILHNWSNDDVSRSLKISKRRVVKLKESAKAKLKVLILDEAERLEGDNG